jgi:putative ABC transport system permease protein
MIKGRNFSGPPDTLHSIVVNESMVKQFGWDEPIANAKFPGDTSGNYLEVVGVLKDFNRNPCITHCASFILWTNGNVIELKMRLGPFSRYCQERAPGKIFPAIAF